MVKCPLPHSVLNVRSVVLACSNLVSSGAVNLSSVVPLSLPVQPVTPAKNTFAYCGSPRYKQQDATAVVEFVEYYKFLGVQKFYLYIESVSDEVWKVIRYYESHDVVDVKNWSLPVPLNKILYHSWQL